MFDMRRREEAEGERRIMGSGRRFFLGRETREGLVGMLGACVDAGGAFLEVRERERNVVSAILRTWEKS